MACVVLSVFKDGLCRTVCLFLQMACVVLSGFTDTCVELFDYVCRGLVLNCLFLQMNCLELSVFAYGLCRTVCFCIWLVSNCLFFQLACVELSVFADSLRPIV